MNKLLQRRPVKRLGWNGITELKNHKWLRGIPWKELAEKSIPSPFQQKFHPTRVKYQKTENDPDFKKILAKNKEMLRKGVLQDFFYDYTFQGV